MKKQTRTFTCYTTAKGIDEIFYSGEYIHNVVSVGFHKCELDARKSDLEGQENIKKVKITVELTDAK